MTRSSIPLVCLTVLALAIVAAPSQHAAEAVSSGPELRDFMEIGLARLDASDGDLDDVFGNAIAIDGDTAVISAPWDRDQGEFSGSAYVFVRSNGRWTEQAKLLPSDGRPFGLFGYSIAIDGDTVVVGAPDWNFYIDPGSAYVFTRNAGRWSQQAKLEVPWVRAGHKFGHEVALDGDTAIVGAPRDDLGGDSAGAAYVFTRSGGVWHESAVLRPADGGAPSWFGKVVSLDGDAVLIGAPYDDDRGEWSGSAYTFRRSGEAWSETSKYTALDGEAWDGFGFGLALDGVTAIVGAPFREGEPCGAYVYRQRIGPDSDTPR